MVINVFCGVVSGVLSSSLANPTDVLKVILNAEDKIYTEISVYQYTKANPEHQVHVLHEDTLSFNLMLKLNSDFNVSCFRMNCLVCG